MLKKGADVTSKDDYGDTPLLEAAQNGNFQNKNRKISQNMCVNNITNIYQLRSPRNNKIVSGKWSRTKCPKQSQ